MKKIFLLLVTTLLLMSCGKDKKSDELFYNIDLKIVSINSDDSLTQDKFHTPRTCNIVLFETMGDDKLYCEINTCKLNNGCGCNKIHINTEWLYNHCSGDVVHFDYIRKDRFFKINRDKHY